MEGFELVVTQEPKLERPVLVEGLPGIGAVGELAVQHLVKALRAKKFARLYSVYFIPQVLIKESGVMEETKNELYYLKRESGQRDLVLLTGNTQAITPEGQFRLSSQILDIAEKLGVEEVYTLGGLGTGSSVEKAGVYGAVTGTKYIKLLEEHGVTVRREGKGQIVGLSGLLLSQGMRRGIPGMCLMGETSGFYVDYRAAARVLELLVKLLNIQLDIEEFREKGREAERKLRESKGMEQKMMERLGYYRPASQEINYIG